MRAAEIELAGPGSVEYRKLYLAVNRIASHLESERGTLNRALGRLDRLERIIMGDDKLPGLKVSVDLLNDNMKRRTKLHWMILTAVIGILAVKVGEVLWHIK